MNTTMEFTQVSPEQEALQADMFGGKDDDFVKAVIVSAFKEMADRRNIDFFEAIERFALACEVTQVAAATGLDPELVLAAVTGDDSALAEAMVTLLARSEDGAGDLLGLGAGESTVYDFDPGDED